MAKEIDQVDNLCSDSSCVAYQSRRETPSDDESFIYRKSTFKQWPTSTGIEPAALVASGFSYTGNRDVVICSSCGVEIGDWKPYDVPANRHRTMSPRCRFLIDIRTDSNTTCSDSHAPTEIDLTREAGYDGVSSSSQWVRSKITEEKSEYNKSYNM